MNRMTPYRRLKKLGVSKSDVNEFAFGVAFDPIASYKHMVYWSKVRDVLLSFGIRTIDELRDKLEGATK